MLIIVIPLRFWYSGSRSSGGFKYWKIVWSNFSLFSKRMGFFLTLTNFTNHDKRYALRFAFFTDTKHGHGHVFVLGFMIRDGLFCFGVSPYASRLTPCGKEGEGGWDLWKEKKWQNSTTSPKSCSIHGRVLSAFFTVTDTDTMAVLMRKELRSNWKVRGD